MFSDSRIQRILSAALLLALTCTCKPQVLQSNVQSSTIPEYSGEIRIPADGLKLGCPKFLIGENVVNLTQNAFDRILPFGYTSYTKSCTALDSWAFPNPSDLETYLSKHPLTQLGTEPNAVGACFTDLTSGHPTLLTAANPLSTFERYKGMSDDLKSRAMRSTIADYFYYMRTLQDLALSNAEGIAALDLLLGRAPLVPARAYGMAYSDAFLPKTPAWEAALKSCAPTPDAFDEIVAKTKESIAMLAYQGWVIDRLDWVVSQNTDTANVEKAKTNLVQMKQSRDAVMQITPWVAGKFLKRFSEWRTLTGYSKDRLTNSSSAQIFKIITKAMDIKAADPTQLPRFVRLQFEDNRYLMIKKQALIIEAARCIHSTDSRCKEILIEAFHDTPPFDSKAFEDRFTADDKAVLDRLSTNNDPNAKEYVALKARLFSAASAMFSSECRAGIRDTNQTIHQVNMAVPQFLLIGGLTSLAMRGLMISDVALATARGQEAAALAAETEINAGQTLQNINRLKLMRNSIRAALVANDSYWMGNAFVDTKNACYKAINDTIENFYLPQSNETPTCRTSDKSPVDNQPLNATALRARAVNDYTSCIFVGALNFVTGVLPMPFSMRGYFKHVAVPHISAE